MEATEFLASPLTETLAYFKENKLKYKLKEIKPPFETKFLSENDKPKRVLKIERKNNFYLITWSFQYNS
ncbi:hypothetical protein [Halanaerobium praevalens]|uniref:Uncharacterized protein n=1 Tax=Halanaerobium praevalens (strain ATCC 33744 / DSM 2228 / GSL) TaxID=572479 RepID=E3DRX6_HALPG|nr:hypothetical protein [Halanaerobium praevalens]ADO77100.1 hypothetical protein Hprae_0946 [Halanaerobium praevalens DSM 2228]